MKWTFLMILFTSNAYSEELVTLKDFLKSELSATAKLSQEVFTLVDSDKKELTGIAPEAEDATFKFYFGKNSVGLLVKACTVLPQKGKEGPMSVGICFDPKGLVQSVVVLAQEEQHGKKISGPAFLKQFTSKKVSDAFIVGKDIDAISGATWSSKAVSEAVRRASFGFKRFVQNKK